MGMKKKSKDQKQNAIMDKDGKNHDKERVITDDRFVKVHSDPRFQKVPKHKAKVAIDSRFSAMFTDKRFATSSAPLDKRGKLKKGSSKNELRRYYRLEEEEARKEGKNKKKNMEKEKEEDEGRQEGKGGIEDKSDESDSDSTELESGDELLLSKSKDDGEEEKSEDSVADSDEEEEVDMESDSSTSTTDTDEEVDANLEDDASMEVENVPIIEKETHRLAVVNMDWSQVKAADLIVVLSSFLPKGGQILSVSVYPSDFGLKRMEEEAVHGPAALFGAKDENDDNHTDDDEEEEMDNEKLRAYERSRLRYYYAVVVCDSIATADYLYKTCDGVEFERSSNVLDLRFIPDDMEFKHPPRDRVTEAPAGYEGLDFHTRALQHSNVHLSWDDDEPHRVKTLKRKFNADQLADLELKEFLASDVSESEEDDNETGVLSEKKNKQSEKYRALLSRGDDSEEEEDEPQDMEVTFNTGLEDISKKILERKDTKSETVWEKYLRKRKEKKKARKNRSKQSSDDESDFSDEEPIQEPNDFFEEEPPAKSRKTDVGRKKKAEVETIETEKEAAASRAELELLLADDNELENNIKGYKIKPDKGKRKKGKKEAPAEDNLPKADFDDPRFAALCNNPLFALDPTDPQFKRSATYARQLAQEQHKGQEELLNEELSKITKQSRGATINKHGDNEVEGLKSDTSTKKDKHELSLLVKSVKMKAKQVPLSLHNGKMDSSSSSRRKRKQDHSAKRKGNAGP